MQEQFTAIGKYSTAHASKYLQQLCKHFGHKVEVEYDEKNGKVAFAFGDLSLTANENELIAVLHVKEKAAILRGQAVIDNHLVKFAFREEFEHMNWSL